MATILIDDDPGIRRFLTAQTGWLLWNFPINVMMPGNSDGWGHSITSIMPAHPGRHTRAIRHQIAKTSGLTALALNFSSSLPRISS